MNKRNKVKDQKKLNELKKMRLFEDQEKVVRPEDLDNLAGGAQDSTTVNTQWPTTS